MRHPPETTEAEKRVLDGLFSFIKEKGYTPSQMELAKKVGLKSANTVDYHLGKLEKKGFVKCPQNRFRAIEIVPEFSPYPNFIGTPVFGTVPISISNLPIEKYKEATMDRKSSAYENRYEIKLSLF